MSGQWNDPQSNDFYIISQIVKYITINLDQGHAVMITFLRRDLEKGNRKADQLGKLTKLSINTYDMKIL